MESWISDNDIERLEKVRDILKEIKELDLDFGISNIIEADNNTILVFRCVNMMLKEKDLALEAQKLTDKLRCECVVVNDFMRLDKALKVGIDYAKGRDYTTETFYSEGQVIKETTTQYK